MSVLECRRQFQSFAQADHYFHLRRFYGKSFHGQHVFIVAFEIRVEVCVFVKLLFRGKPIHVYITAQRLCGIIENAETGTHEYGKIILKRGLVAQWYVFLVIRAVEEARFTRSAIELCTQINHGVDVYGGFRDGGRNETVHRLQRILRPDELFFSVFHLYCDIGVRVLLYGQTGHISFFHVLQVQCHRTDGRPRRIQSVGALRIVESEYALRQGVTGLHQIVGHRRSIQA